MSSRCQLRAAGPGISPVSKRGRVSQAEGTMVQAPGQELISNIRQQEEDNMGKSGKSGGLEVKCTPVNFIAMIRRFYYSKCDGRQWPILNRGTWWLILICDS